MSVDLEHYLIVGAILFSIGLYVALAKRNFVGVLMGIELMFNAVNLTFVAFSRFVESPNPLDGHVFVVFVDHGGSGGGGDGAGAGGAGVPGAGHDQCRPD